MTENSFIKKLKQSGRSLVVFYGSQTGTAEEFAGRLAKEGMRYKLKGMVADPEECDMEELLQLKDIPNSLAVFCLATYGEGDPTDNAMEFYEWITNGDVDLSGLNYAVSASVCHSLSVLLIYLYLERKRISLVRININCVYNAHKEKQIRECEIERERIYINLLILKLMPGSFTMTYNACIRAFDYYYYCCSNL